MKQTVNIHSFRDAFQRMDRNNFSYGGLEVLFDHIESIEADTGEELEFDVVALCCDFAEDDAESIAAQYDIDLSEAKDDADKLAMVLLHLYDHTIVCGTTSTDTIVYLQF